MRISGLNTSRGCTMANVREPIGHDIDPDDAMSRIQSADQELFAVQSGKERPEDGRSGDRVVHWRGGRLGPVIANECDPESRHRVCLPRLWLPARSDCPVNREWPCPPPSSSRCLAPPFTSRGWGVEEEGGMARSRGTGLNGRGPTGRHREGLAAALQRQLAPTGDTFRWKGWWNGDRPGAEKNGNRPGRSNRRHGTAHEVRDDQGRFRATADQTRNDLRVVT